MKLVFSEHKLALQFVYCVQMVSVQHTIFTWPSCRKL